MSIGAAFILMIGCSTKPERTGKVAARVGDLILTDDEISIWEASLQGQQASVDARAAFIRRWIEDELLVQAARDRGLTNDPWVQARMDELSRKLLTARLIDMETDSLVKPSRREIETYYRDHLEEFMWAKLHLRVKYWRSSSRQTLDRLRRELTAARPTPLIPQEMAPVDSGEIEVDGPESATPETWRLLGWMREEQVGYPVHYRDRYWLFQVTRRDEAGSFKKIEDVSEEISSRLLDVQRSQRIASLIQDLTIEYRRTGRLEWHLELDSSIDRDVFNKE